MHHHHTATRRALAATAVPLAAVSLLLAACGPATSAAPRPGPGAQVAGAAPAAAAWRGDCPHADGSAVAHVAVVELSPSERSAELLADRLVRLRRHAQQAADCEAPLTVHLLTGSRSEPVYHTEFDSPLGTEPARDRQVDTMADGAMAAVTPALEAAAQTGPASGSGPGSGSDPGGAYRVLADELQRLDPNASVDALILSDGVTVTDAVDLNHSLDGADLDRLAADVAPAVDLAGRVTVDWPAIGRTADPAAPPGPWLDALRLLWQRVCETRHAAACTITTI